jgi:hypothetical protein
MRILIASFVRVGRVSRELRRRKTLRQGGDRLKRVVAIEMNRILDCYFMPKD